MKSIFHPTNTEILSHLNTKFGKDEVYNFCKIYAEMCRFIASERRHPEKCEESNDAHWWNQVGEWIMDEIRKSPNIKDLKPTENGE